jgi:hypothetical protein
MEIPYLALSKQIVLAMFTVVFTLMAIVVWTSDVNKHADLPLKESEHNHG